MPADYTKPYIRPAKMLLTLRDELNAVFPGRYTGTDGFPSGYDGPDNPRYQRSAHNANSNGHVMAFDISTPANGMQIDEATGRALSEYLRIEMNVKFAYLIHDMSPGLPEPKIAGNHTGWEWWTYVGDPHSNHIHISLTGDYLWGDDCGLSQEIYDNTDSWGIAEWYARYAGTEVAPTPTPTPEPAPQPPVSTRKTYSLQDPHWTVEPGDTLSRIAEFYYGEASAATLQKIADYNGMGVNDTIFPGENIWIPGPFGWVIEAPDTIRSISARYGFDPNYIAALNGLPSADSEIYIGNTLWLKK